MASENDILLFEKQLGLAIEPERQVVVEKENKWFKKYKSKEKDVTNRNQGEKEAEENI